MDVVLKIHDYHENYYLVNLEENWIDIRWAIKFKDHSDTFILVCTNDEKIYCYGWWKDRYYLGNYVREPELFAKEIPWGANPFKKDKYYSSTLLWDIKYCADVYTTHNPKLSAVFYQERFNEVVKNLIKAFNTGYYYDWSKYKTYILHFLKVNHIDTEKNLEILEHAPWTSLKIDGCIGVAAKVDWTKRVGFYCDDLLSVWYEGSWHDTECVDIGGGGWADIIYRNLPYKWDDPDEWGDCEMIFDFREISNCLAQSVLF